MDITEYKFQPLPGPTKYKIYDHGKVVLPKGTPDVEVAWGASSQTYVDKKTGAIKHQNVYRHNGKIYNV